MKKQLFLLLLVSACSGAATPTSAPEVPGTEQLDLTDPAETLEVTAGEEFTITVAANLGSGQHWELAQELDPGIVDYVWKDFVPMESDVPDSNGRDIWRFKALAPGETQIVLGHYVGMTEDTLEVLTFNVLVK